MAGMAGVLSFPSTWLTAEHQLTAANSACTQLVSVGNTSLAGLCRVQIESECIIIYLSIISVCYHISIYFLLLLLAV